MELLGQVSAGEGVEVELKLDLETGNLNDFAALRALRGIAAQDRGMFATYFDTPGQDLRAAGVSLRVRRTGERYVQTIKANASSAVGMFARSEWEHDVAGPAPELDAASPLHALISGDVLAHIVPVFTVAVARRQWNVEHGGAIIEIVADVGAVSAAGRSDAVSEVELELKRGHPAALFELARDLGRDLPLRVGVLTKGQRGYRLLETVSAGSVKAERLTLRSDATAAEAFASIADACLRQFRLNEDILRRDPQADALHQARVALRRLRSALSLFKPILADARFEHLAGELRWLAGSLGEARDLDVLVARIGDEPDEAIVAAHRTAYSEALAALDSQRARDLFLDLVEWAILGEWRTQPVRPETVNERADLFAAQVLGRLRRRLKRRGRDLARLDDAERHRVRILGKKLRYAAGFFESLYTGKEARHRFKAFLKRMEALQNHLGELNDLATAPALVARVGLEVNDFSPSGRRGIVLAKAERAYRKWVDAKTFW